jgi:hypothetical protein
VYPPIEPYEHGLLDVGDGNSVYWESVGTPLGTPALYLHGGPGSGATVGARRYFDPTAFQAVLFDQRGCGRSRPLVTDPGVVLSTNTTDHLVADIEHEPADPFPRERHLQLTGDLGEPAAVARLLAVRRLLASSARLALIPDIPGFARSPVGASGRAEELWIREVDDQLQLLEAHVVALVCGEALGIRVAVELQDWAPHTALTSGRMSTTTEQGGAFRTDRGRRPVAPGGRPGWRP